ncbi:hypothetical protein O6H91_03G124100 [Diphasiastrum complanatum]|uniref:Uncharacterized protein n=2 Tax=Diphasiastrum complanatum TaxID=34168 RepID=A0ACC2EB68_DIPCM|nr:hypothetical protein O6H91_03G122400 [Diphasiastrum complanatum]KAJ7563739.1 hypothetical protein O6H91_03G124100 [Diphasiastrum complanatum]
MGCLKLVLGILGNATAVALFIAPLPTFWTLMKKKSTMEYSGLPYVCTLFNCLLWIFYGMPFVKPHSMLIITINGFGCAIELIYLTVYIIYADRKNQLKVLGMLLAVILAFTVVAVLTVTVLHTHNSRTTVVGSVCVVVAIAMYVSPLSIMKLVIQTRSVEYMPFLLSLFVFLNSMAWTSYALVTKDIFIGIPNGLGCLSGVAQLALYVFYRYLKPVTASLESGDKPLVNNVYVEIGKSNEKLNENKDSKSRLINQDGNKPAN